MSSSCARPYRVIGGILALSQTPCTFIIFAERGGHRQGKWIRFNQLMESRYFVYHLHNNNKCRCDPAFQTLFVWCCTGYVDTIYACVNRPEFIESPPLHLFVLKVISLECAMDYPNPCICQNEIYALAIRNPACLARASRCPHRRERVCSWERSWISN